MSTRRKNTKKEREKQERFTATFIHKLSKDDEFMNEIQKNTKQNNKKTYIITADRDSNSPFSYYAYGKLLEMIDSSAPIFNSNRPIKQIHFLNFYGSANDLKRIILMASRINNNFINRIYITETVKSNQAYDNLNLSHPNIGSYI